MTSSVFVKNKSIYISIYDWFYIRWLLPTMDPWNEWNTWNGLFTNRTVEWCHKKRF